MIRIIQLEYNSTSGDLQMKTNISFSLIGGSTSNRGILCLGNDNYVISSDSPSSDSVYIININPDNLTVTEIGNFKLFNNVFGNKL